MVVLGEFMYVCYILCYCLVKKDLSLLISEFVELIVYYLDLGVFELVKIVLFDGVKWWNDVFSVVGYKNVFIVKVLFDDVDFMDVCYNVI